MSRLIVVLETLIELHLVGGSKFITHLNYKTIRFLVTFSLIAEAFGSHYWVRIKH
jgi:hypothetical protein